LPHDRQHLRFEKETFAIAVTARTDPASLAQLLPARCELDGEARLEIGIYHLTQVGWLAGRGYNIAMLRIPAVFAIVNGLAALPLEFLEATLMRTSGGGDLSSQRIVY